MTRDFVSLRVKQFIISIKKHKKMDTKYFPHFVRANFPNLSNESNESLIPIGNEFKKYLESKFVDKMDKLKDIWDIDPKTVILNQMNDPFSINGYNPALLLHFTDFIKEQLELPEEK
jgi:hypothetical protein